MSETNINPEKGKPESFLFEPGGAQLTEEERMINRGFSLYLQGHSEALMISSIGKTAYEQVMNVINQAPH